MAERHHGQRRCAQRLEHDHAGREQFRLPVLRKRRVEQLGGLGNGVTAGNSPIFVEPFASQTALGFGFNGSLADFSLYNGVLTPTQIAGLYAGQAYTFGGSLPSQAPLQIASGTVFDLAGAPQSLESLSDLNGGGGKVTDSVAGAVTVTLAPTGTSSFSGVIQNGAGTLSLLLAGTGTQILAGSNTYSGGTTIQGGVLGITHDYNLGASSGALASPAAPCRRPPA